VPAFLCWWGLALVSAFTFGLVVVCSFYRLVLHSLRVVVAHASICFASQQPVAPQSQRNSFSNDARYSLSLSLSLSTISTVVPLLHICKAWAHI